MEEILHQLICSLSHDLQGFIHPRWCRIPSINSKHDTLSKISRLIGKGMWVVHGHFTIRGQPSTIHLQYLEWWVWRGGHVFPQYIDHHGQETLFLHRRHCTTNVFKNICFADVVHFLAHLEPKLHSIVATREWASVFLLNLEPGDDVYIFMKMDQTNMENSKKKHSHHDKFQFRLIHKLYLHMRCQ